MSNWRRNWRIIKDKVENSSYHMSHQQLLKKYSTLSFISRTLDFKDREKDPKIKFNKSI